MQLATAFMIGMSGLVIIFSVETNIHWEAMTELYKTVKSLRILHIFIKSYAFQKGYISPI